MEENPIQTSKGEKTRGKTKRNKRGKRKKTVATREGASF